MIVGLLKELAVALPRYVRYRARQAFGRSAPRAAARGGPVALPARANATPSVAAGEPGGIGLEPALLAPVSWPSYKQAAPPPELLASPLYQIWEATPNRHKWLHYFAIYQSVLGPWRGSSLRILEIGVYRGSSLLMWREYFTHPETVIVGIDIDPDCLEFDAPERGVHVHIGSQTDRTFLAQMVLRYGPFDVIIDDGSHHSSHIITSFNHLFLTGLKDPGIYLVEDLHANYWRPWRDSANSFLDLCKELVEAMHAHYAQTTAATFFVKEPADQVDAIEVPLITTLVEEIRFFDSIVAIYKARRPFIPHYRRSETER